MSVCLGDEICYQKRHFWENYLESITKLNLRLAQTWALFLFFQITFTITSPTEHVPVHEWTYINTIHIVHNIYTKCKLWHIKRPTLYVLDTWMIPQITQLVEERNALNFQSNQTYNFLADDKTGEWIHRFTLKRNLSNIWKSEYHIIRHRCLGIGSFSSVSNYIATADKTLATTRKWCQVAHLAFCEENVEM